MAIKHAATVTYPNGNIVSYHYDDEHPETPFSTLGDGESSEAVHARIEAIRSGKADPIVADLETMTALLASKHDEERRASLAVANLEKKKSDLDQAYSEAVVAHDALIEEHEQLISTVAEMRMAVAPADVQATPATKA